jgi:hypothetical protein
MPVGKTHVMAFHQHPRLIRLCDGAVEFSLPEFALAQEDNVHVISIVVE